MSAPRRSGWESAWSCWRRLHALIRPIDLVRGPSPDRAQESRRSRATSDGRSAAKAGPAAYGHRPAPRLTCALHRYVARTSPCRINAAVACVSWLTTRCVGDASAAGVCPERDLAGATAGCCPHGSDRPSVDALTLEPLDL